MQGEALDILIGRYLDGQATAAESAEIERLIAADPSVAKEMIRAAWCEAMLADALTPATTAETDEPIRLPVAATSGRRFSSVPRWGVWAAAACVLLGLGLGWKLMRSPAADQPVTPIVLNETPLPLAGGGKLAVNQPVRTGDSPMVLALAAENTRLTLSPNSSLAFAGESTGKRFKLTSGRVECQADHQPAGKPLVIETGTARVTVVGTKFDVSTDTGWTRVKVTEGTVRVRRQADGATVDVSAGQYVEVPAAPVGGVKSPQWAGAATGKDMSEYWSVKIQGAGMHD